MKNFILFIVSLCMLATTACSDPFKVTDPSDPKFNPDKFKFEDYPGIPLMTDALKKLFPVGTPKEFVEKILVDVGGARLENILTAEQIEKKNKSWKGFSPELECALIKPVRDYYIYGKVPDYILPTKRNWAVGVQYDEDNKLSLLQLNGTTINGVINCEELK
ncbi:MAG: hypothetical protein KDJ50_04175 [Alphaproteobacteria bacterium]|nr:hypothetical protein [Alphaproteobacteria bacterium]